MLRISELVGMEGRTKNEEGETYKLSKDDGEKDGRKDKWRDGGREEENLCTELVNEVER